MATIKKNPGAIERVRPAKPVAPPPAAQTEAEDTEFEEAPVEEDGPTDEPENDTEQDDASADTGDDADSMDDGAEDATDDDLDADAQGGADTAEEEAEATKQPPAPQTPASAPAKPPAQAGFAKRVGRETTKPVKPVGMQRPYLESPRDFGIHIEGHLVRFKKGRTPIRKDNPVFAQHALTVAQVLDAIKADSYVADNGAELHE